MKFALYGISALEYWRIAGSPGIPVPKPSRAAGIPDNVSEPIALISLEKLPGIQYLSKPVHIGISDFRSAYHRDKLAFRSISGRAADRQLYSINQDIGISSPETCLVQSASCLNLIELIGLTHEFCGYYSPSQILENGLFKRNPLTDARKLERASEQLAGTHGIKAFNRALSYFKGPSRSPMETALALCISLPLNLGGYAFSDLVLNAKAPLDVFTRQSSRVAELEPDILFPTQGLCIEYDGRAFHEGTDAVKRDVRRINSLISSNYKVLTLTSSQLFDYREMHKFALSVAHALGRRIRVSDKAAFDQKRYKLRRLVLSSDSVLKNQQLNQAVLAYRKKQ